LSSYEVLDHPRDPIYSDLAHLAATICGTELGAITLLDRERQWILALTGSEPGETSRDVAFCAHTILSPLETTVVEDARLDPRFSDNPYVVGEPGIRFYAGAPVLSSEGYALGAICVYANNVAHLTEMQKEALAALARQVGTQLELRRTLMHTARQAEALARETKRKPRTALATHFSKTSVMRSGPL
jgi:GAF domain-containing protein